MELIEKTAKSYPWKTALFIKIKDKLILPLSAVDKETPRKGKICELGSGFGMVSHYLARSSSDRKIEGYELSRDRVKKATKASRKLKNVKFFQRNLVLDPITKRYEIFLMVDFLHHISYRSQMRIIQNISEKQQPGDLIIIKDIAKEIGIKYSLNFFCDKMITRLDSLFFRPSKEWAEILSDRGYEVKKKQLKGLFPHFFIKAIKR